MQFQVTFKNMPYSEALSELTKKKINPIIDRFITKPTKAHVVYSVDKGVHSAQCKISAGDGMALQAQADSSFMYATLDQLVDKLDTQLRRKKEKLKHHKGSLPTHEFSVLQNDANREESLDAENILHYERARQRYYQERFAEPQKVRA